MKKRKNRLLQRMIVILLSIVLTAEMVCNTVPDNVFAQENAESQENIDGNTKKEQEKKTAQYEENAKNERAADIEETIISSDEEWDARTLEAGIYTINPGVTVTITGRLRVNSDVTIRGGGKIVRGYSDAYFSVSGGNLILQNIEIDGASLSANYYAMVEVSNNGMATLDDGCWIHHCYKSRYKGAAFYLNKGSAVFEDAIIENCQATYYGGAICIEDKSTLIINDGTYQNNSTSSSSIEPCGGGFIYNISSKLKIYGGSFIDNTSSGKGGCIYNTGLEGSETYLYGGYFQGNKSFYNKSDGKGSGAIFYSSQNTANAIIQLSGNVQFCGDGTADSGVDGVFLDFADDAQRKAQISSQLEEPIVLYLDAKEGRVIAQGVEGYQLQKKDMKKISFIDIGKSDIVYYAKLDEENNQIILTNTDPGYPLYVTYSSNGADGSVSDENEYKIGDIATVQSENGLTHQNGYNFDGWNTKRDGTGTNYEAGASFEILEDITLYAQWIRGIKVTYDYATNGGDSATQIFTDALSGEDIDLTPTASKTGWEFVGWNTDPDAEEGLVSLKMEDEKIILYAIYKKDLKLTFYSGKAGEKVTQEITLYNKQEDATFTFPELKDLDISDANGYVAYGWSDNKELISEISEENTSGQASEDMIFYGAYQKEIKVSYNANNGSGNVPESQTLTNYAIVSDAECKFYTKDSESIKLQNGTGLSRIGYTFNGWIEGSETGEAIEAGTSVNPTEDTVYYASWIPVTYHVTLHTNSGDSGTDLASYTYETGAALPLDWTKKGYIFGGWFDNEDLTGEAITDISDKDTGDKEYWAKWNLINYTITYDLDGGTVSDNPSSYTVESDNITLNNPTKEGYTFTGWSGTDLTENHTNVIITKGSTENRTYTANWALEVYNVTLHTNGGDSGTTLNSYTYGTVAALPSDWTKKGYVFGGWFDNEDLTGTAITNISNKDTGDKEYWAKWIDNIPPVLGTLSYSYEPKNLWQWLIGKESLIITVPVTEEGSGADQITYEMTSKDGNTSSDTAEIKNNIAKIIVDADFKGTIRITCTDKAGNISAEKTANEGYNGFIIEGNAPQIEFQTDSADIQDEYMTAPAITVSITDDKDNAISSGIASVTYKIGNNAETVLQQDFAANMKTNTSFVIPADKISAGETVIIVTAIDNAGNQNTVTKTIKIHIHNGIFVPATAAECTTSGTIAYYTCSCGKRFFDSECTTQITNDADIILKELGHDFSVIQYDENGHWKKCSRCEEKQSIEAHIFDNDKDTTCNKCGYERSIELHTHKYSEQWENDKTSHWHECVCGKKADVAGHIEDEGIVTKEATATDMGIKTYKCTVCAYIMRTETIPATGSGNITVIAPVISEGAPDSNFASALDEVKKAVILTQEEQAEVVNGTDINIWLDVKPVTPTENKKTLIEAKKGDYTIGTYMDISMFKQVGDKTPDFVSQLNKKIKISIVIPEQLRNTDKNAKRAYQVLHYHDTETEAEVLTGIYDEKTFTYTFETDRFSTYAIAYKDSREPAGSNGSNDKPTDTIKEDNIPKTNDSGILEIWLWILVLSGIGIIYFGKIASHNIVSRKNTN